jgi:hypothetical protein
VSECGTIRPCGFVCAKSAHWRRADIELNSVACRCAVSWITTGSESALSRGRYMRSGTAVACFEATIIERRMRCYRACVQKRQRLVRNDRRGLDLNFVVANQVAGLDQCVCRHGRAEHAAMGARFGGRIALESFADKPVMLPARCCISVPLKSADTASLRCSRNVSLWTQISRSPTVTQDLSF